MEFDRRNLIVGPNGAGKTSVLEAIAYAGRGKSFRGAGVDKLVRHGERSFVLSAEVRCRGRNRRLGVRNGVDGLETRVDGEVDVGAAALASVLPLQVVDPDVHNLVAGGPEERRRYLDWLAFHVEHGYLEQWRRFRRVLRQRNAVLKGAPSAAELDSWDRELAAAAEPMSRGREAAFLRIAPVLEKRAAGLLGAVVGVEFRRGWPNDGGLPELLREGRERDVAIGRTQIGPQRADLALRYDDRLARKLVSRGQQKLLACALVLGGVEVVQEVLGEPMLLLLDDPAAELDAESVARLMGQAEQLGCQIIATALSADTGLFSRQARLFHVEHGQLSREA